MYKREYTCDRCGYKTPRKQNLEIHHSRKSACEKRLNRKQEEELLKSGESMLCVECVEPEGTVDSCSDYNKPKLDHIDYKRTCELYEETVTAESYSGFFFRHSIPSMILSGVIVTQFAISRTIKSIV